MPLGGEDSSSNTCPIAATAAAPAAWRGTNDSATEYCRRGNTPAAYGRYQRNNSTAPYSTPPSNVERTTPHHRWYANSDRVPGATGGESTPSTPGGGTEGGGRRRRNSGSGSSRSDSSSPEPSDTSRASTPAAQPSLSHHPNHRTPPSLQHQWASTASGRPLAICVRNLPTRSTDSSLKDGLYHEYKKHGKVVWVKVVGQNADRYAVVRFKKPSDVEKALEVSQDKLFFGCKISVAPHQSCDEDADSAKPYETDIDEYHPKMQATRTLFIGNLEKDVTQQQLRDKFKHFGRIIEIDIKKGSSGGAGYAFCQYASISSVVEAIRAMDGENVGGSRVKLGFGKPVATTCVWVDGLTEHTEKQVLSAVSRCGGATSVCVDRAAGAALEAFYEQLEKHGGSAALTGSERLSGDLATRYLPPTRHDPVRFDGAGSRSRASSYGRASSRTPRYSTLEHYDPTDYAADRRYRVYDEVGSSPQAEETPYEERLQSVVVSPHRARRHRRDSSPDDRKHSKMFETTSRDIVVSVPDARGLAPEAERGTVAGAGTGGGARARGRTRAPARRCGTSRTPRPWSRAGRPRAPAAAHEPAAAQVRRAAHAHGGSAPHSPSLEERIRSLDEKLNGSRILAEAPDRTRLRHRLLDVDINEVKPSEVVRSLLAKRSVFDEDSERLEGAGRAPSPGSSPRGRLAAATPRALRYPFPAHPLPPAPPAALLPGSLDLDGDMAEHAPLKLSSNLCHEIRGRPRTPPPPPPPPEPETELERENQLVQNDNSSQFESDTKAIEKHTDNYSADCVNVSLITSGGTEDSIDGEDNDRIRDRSKYSIATTSLSKQTSSVSLNADSGQAMRNDNLPKNDHQDDKTNNSSLSLNMEDNSAREVMEMLLKRVEFNDSQKCEPQFEKHCSKYNKEGVIKAELHKHDERLKLDSENKIDLFCHTDKHNSREIQENHITKELIEFELQQNHLNSVNFMKTNVEINQDVKNSEKIMKDRHNHNYHNTKLEKENIQFDKSFEKERNTNAVTLTDKKIDSERNHDERVRLDRDKIRHSKEKFVDKEKSESEKLKSNKSEKHADKEKRPKDEQHEKTQSDKNKSEKDGERNQKDKTDKEFEKSKHNDEKQYRHDHHKKDRSDRKRERNPKMLKARPLNRRKMINTNTIEQRKIMTQEEKVRRNQNRDETSRELSRKDSTDSSTSRASHESTKLKDLEIDPKEDGKSKLKQIELFVKHENDKESKSDNKEEKDSGNQHKNKNDVTSEHITKLKGDSGEKQRHYSLDSPSVDSKRKERLNSCSSLPSNIGHKRRMSSQDSVDIFNEDVKKGRNDSKISERRDSKESRSENRHKTTKFSKGHFAKIIESKTKDDKKNQVKPPDDTYIEKLSEPKDTKTVDKIKSLKKSLGDETEDKPSTDSINEGLQNDLDFLATLELRSSEEDERQRALRKEMKEKKRIQQLQQIQELQLQRDALHPTEFMGKNKEEKKPKCDEKKKELAREKRMSTERKSRDDKNDTNKRKSRKPVHSSDSSDSDEPKKHSIFDIIDDGPTYISIKKYCSMDNSSDDDIVIHTKRREKSHRYDYDSNKPDEYFDGNTNEEDLRNKLSRKNSRTRIMSDTSDDEASKRSVSKSPTFGLDNVKKELLSDSESTQKIKLEITKESSENIKKNSLLNLFGKSDSDDSKIKLNLENDNGYKSNYIKSMCNDFSSESESACNKNSLDNRRKHKKKQKKHKSTYSDDEKIDNSDTSLVEGYKHKTIDKQRRHSNRKDKRKEKLRESIDTDDTRDEKSKIKREKKSSNNNFDGVTDSVCSTMKKDGKMEDIFGPLSDESDGDTRTHATHKMEFSSHEAETSFSANNPDYKSKEKDERRKKEKKRKENRFFKDDDNSLDVDAVGKAIEARLFADALMDDDSRIKAETLSESLNKFEKNDIKYAEGNVISEIVKHDKIKRDCKEKKKKKKKNREDRQSRKEHHNYYQQEKADKADHDTTENEEISTNTLLLDIPLPNDVQTVNFDKAEESHSHLEPQSLPRLTDSPPIVIQSDENTDSKSVDSSNTIIDDNKMDYIENKEIEIEEIPMPPPFETIVTDISEVPLPKDPLPSKLNNNTEDCFLSSLSSDGDSCEDAVRNITSSEKEADKTEKIETSSDIVEISPCKNEKKPDEKPRAIISQEETEDAVAALLGESFGGKINTFSNCYEESENNSTHPNEIEIATIENENIPEEDAEEMRQAVQNLNASEMEMKPDTPVSDNDLLLIDTDTEENDETAQDAIEKLPVNIIATNQTLHAVTEQKKNLDNSNAASLETKPNLAPVVTTTASDTTVKVKETDIKIQLTKRENIQLITSTATPVITSWTPANNKVQEPHILNIQGSPLPNREKNEMKPTHITTNIVQIKTSAPTQNVQINNNTTRPIMAQPRVTAPSFQVINQMIRSQAPTIQPPTIKIPEPHVLYQKPQGIVISPRMPNDPRMQSPKASSQGETMTSPRLTNMTILSTSPQSLNSAGLTSPNAIQQRSPGQVTVVRMQQPPLSPIQTMHIQHGARTMLSPNRPNSVLVQTQGAPIHFNRLPVTPVLTPISKQINNQNKGIGVTTSPLLHQQKIISGDCRKTDQRNIPDNPNENTKIILSPTSLQHSTNPTVMAQNRLISMQNAIHVSNMNTVHLNNKVVINTVSQLNEKRENQPQKTDKINHIPFGSTPIIHVAAVNNTTTSIIQGNKPAQSNIQEINTINRSQGSNVIHSLGSQRIISPVSLGNVLKIDTKKGAASVLSMATIRPPSILTKLGLCTSSTNTTTSVTNVSPLLLKTTCSTGRLNSKFDTDNKVLKPLVLQNHIRDSAIKMEEKIDPIVTTTLTGCEEIVKDKKDFTSTPMTSTMDDISKCETDFEELLKDTTNEIKISNDPDKKLEINVGKTVTLITTSKDTHDTPVSKSMDCAKIENNNTNQTQFTPIAAKNEVDDNAGTESKEIFQQSTVPTDSDEIKKETINQTSNDLNNVLPPQSGNEFLNLENTSKSDESNFNNLLSEDSKATSPIKNDENDSWSGKDVNLESVIKKVDSLCNDNVEIVQKSEGNDVEDEMEVDSNNSEKIINQTPHIMSTTSTSQIENIAESKNAEETTSEKTTPGTTAKRGGRNVRGRKIDKNQDRVQTRQISKPARGTTTKRGRGRAKVDKKIKAIVTTSGNTMPGDVYDFHEDSGDESASSPNKTERPRLILTIKSPNSAHSSVTATSTLSIAQKEQIKLNDKNKDEKNEEFVSPSPNTRKSRRLQEKDVQRSTVDDVIEDVIKGPRTGKESNKKRATRQAAVKANQEKTSDTRKSPRGAKRTRDRSLSDASVDSGDERSLKDCMRDPKTPRLEEQTVEPEPEPATVPRSVPPAAQVLPTVVGPPPAPAQSPAHPTPVAPLAPISAKLAGAFEAVVGNSSNASAAPPSPASPLAQSGGEAARARRPADGVPGALVPVGGSEATDARVQSPALPHRPPSAPATPAQLRPLRMLARRVDERPAHYAATASLPRGAHHPPDLHLKQVAVVGPQPHHVAHHPGAASRVTIASVPALSPQGQIGMSSECICFNFVHAVWKSADLVGSPPPAHQQTSPANAFRLGDSMIRRGMNSSVFPTDRSRQRAARRPLPAGAAARRQRARGRRAVPRRGAARAGRRPAAPYGRSPPPAHASRPQLPPGAAPPAPGPPHASQVPREADSLQMLLRVSTRACAAFRSWDEPPHNISHLVTALPRHVAGLAGFKNDSAAVQMHFVGGNPGVAGDTLSRHADGSTPLLRIAQRMRLEQPQLEQVHRKMKMENEHCMLLALPCGRDHMDVLQQSTNLTAGFITYLQKKQAAGIVNIAPPGHHQAMFTVHIFPSCEFANENLNRIAPDLMHRVADIAHLLIVIATV
ncbi:hypothetical protein HW555_007054 [Spodoptera exigua]|uniref:Protein split ends n=1 Tax=Spodoptera exigua TaxID=7107 RepID=A0A835GHF1_SPOEX|nr:hypothetical protein HW555_007054 [Spodoptera exigua]